MVELLVNLAVLFAVIVVGAAFVAVVNRSEEADAEEE